MAQQGLQARVQGCCRRGGLVCGMPQQDSDVLHRRDHVVLDSLPPQSSPSGALEAMIVGCICKAPLHAPLSAHPVTPGRNGLRLCPSRINRLLLIMAFYAPGHSPGGSGTLCSQRAG